MTLPNYDDVCTAALRLAGYAQKTPVIENDELNRYFGARIRFKCEHMQVISAFKFRGAFNALSKLSEDQLAAGVITFSSGNHGQAIAKAAAILGAKATIVMPTNAPEIKLAGVRSHGANVVLYDPATEEREVVAERLNPNGKMSLIPPFNHPDVIAGQGTSALELLTDFPGTKQLLVPCGGGGLLSGSILAASGLQPECQVYGVEPENADDARQSLARGEIVSINYPDTIADGVRTLSLGDLTFAIIHQHAAGILTVSEDAIKTALLTLMKYCKQWLEPSAVLGLAALLEKQLQPDSEVGIILSGGNADISTIQTIEQSHKALKIS